LETTAYLSAIELAKRIRSRQLSAVELIETLLARIESSQPSLNAFITICRDGALAAAREADAAFKPGKNVEALHGVPISVKAIINTVGIRTTWGSRTMTDNVPNADAGGAVCEPMALRHEASLDVCSDGSGKGAHRRHCPGNLERNLPGRVCSLRSMECWPQTTPT